MVSGERNVKRKRPYDSSGRQARADGNHARIVESAENLFLAGGYAATTIGAIAERAGVSVDTIFKTFGGKAGLVHAIYRRALAGTGPEPAEVRSDRLQTEEPDPRKVIQGWGRFVTEIAPSAAPFLLLIRAAAASEPELRSLLDQIDDERLLRMTANAQRLHDHGHLRPGLSVQAAADVLWTYSSPELYELLVLRRRMPLAEYGRFVAYSMIAALLP